MDRLARGRPRTLRTARARCVGAERCLFGSDWPVCLVAGQYSQVIEALRECLAGNEPAAMARIFGGTAAEVYGLGERLRPPPA